MRAIITFFFLSLVFFSSAQQLFPVKTIKVTENAKVLRNPWAGGMNLPQFSSTDFNGDGKKDLFVFDKDGFIPSVFLNYGSGDTVAFKYSPQYEKFFPSMIRWALLRDYNCDGIDDIFSSCTAGIKLYEGKKIGSDYIYTKVDSPLYSNYMGTQVNIYSANEDIPAIEDIDKDGDLDILVLGSLFRTQIDFYKNTSKETVGTCDSTTYDGPESCWGHLSLMESSTLDMVFGACKTSTGGIPSRGDTIGSYRHSSNSILTFDQDNDGDEDVLVGDVAYTTMVFGKNNGSPSAADITMSDPIFPNYDSTINLNIFPTAYSCDINNDNLKDLIISPNATTSVGVASTDIGNIWYYRNEGPIGNQQFHLVDDSFLVGDMIEAGNSAYPVMFDYNNDSLPDLIVANRGYYDRVNVQYDSKLSLYKNVGTKEIPAFELQTRNYQSLAAIGLIRLRPTFGDLDADGDLDLMLGDDLGTLTYFENDPIAGEADYLGIPAVYDYFSIDIGINATPWLYDVDHDHDVDLLVGDLNGRISFFWNYGDSTTALFSADSVNATFGNINVKTPAYPEGNATPYVSEDTLYVGCYDGNIASFVMNQDSMRRGTFIKLNAKVGSIYAGNNSNLALVDLNGDHQNEYLVGNNRGGVTMYSPIDWDTVVAPDTVLSITSIPSMLEVILYPNPASSAFTIDFKGHQDNFEYSIINMNGQILESKSIKFQSKTDVSVLGWPTGAYFVQIRSAHQVINKKLFIQ